MERLKAIDFACCQPIRLPDAQSLCSPTEVAFMLRAVLPCTGSRDRLEPCKDTIPEAACAR